MKIRIGSRGSKLALVQTNYVMERLKQAYPEHEYEIVVIQTKGDKILDRPLNQIGDKGLFVKEIEQQMLDGNIQMAVHSMKDMPARLPEGLTFSKMWVREDPRDVLILREKKCLADLPYGAVLGTGSERRRRQLKAMRPDLVFVDIRGNVETRIKKMQEQQMDGIVLAAAGLKRLGMEHVITEYLDETQVVPAPAQGILALEVRQDEVELLAMLNVLADDATDKMGTAERIFLEEMGADCHVPVGANCKAEGDVLEFRAVFGREKNTELYTVQIRGEEPKVLAKEAAKKIRAQMAGQVILVGAGPGSPGLLTIQGRQEVEQADCIVYDRLASPEILAFAKEECEMIYVGKENHHHTMNQEDINELLVKKSMEYNRVVRLKGGDPYVFGRGGEEFLYLNEKGIDCQVVPGISSSLAGLAYAGIPITHRGVAHGFHVVTAHNRKDELADIDFHAMAQGKETCVFLMGLSKLGEITEHLRKAGMDQDTAAAVISCATRPEQRTVTGTLADIAEKAEEAKLISPALIVVGNVVKLRDSLNFFEQKPLFGKKYLIPKIGRKPSELAGKLRELGAATVEIPVGRIHFLKPEIDLQKQLQKAEYLIFTSRNGVQGFFQALEEQGLDSRSLAGCRIGVIGNETEKVLKKYGIRADFMPDQFTSLSFEKKLQEILPKDHRAFVLFAGPKSMKSELGKKLSGRCEWVELPVYENLPLDIDESLLQQGRNCDGVFFTCASSAERLVSAYKGTLPDMQVYSIGIKCSKKLEELGITRVIEAKVSNYQGMLDIIT